MEYNNIELIIAVILVIITILSAFFSKKRQTQYVNNNSVGIQTNTAIIKYGSNVNINQIGSNNYAKVTASNNVTIRQSNTPTHNC